MQRENKPIFNKSDAGAVTAPRVISTPDPGYTTEAASNHIEGISFLGIVVDTAGTPTNVAVLQPLGMGLDEQAVLAVKRWKFQPGMKSGEAVPVQINVEINFRCCP
jgi:TonB family protein